MSDLRGYSLTLRGTTTLITETCYSCGTLFAFAEEFKAHRLRDRKSFFCPNGHSQQYVGKTIEKELEEAKTRELALKDQLSAAIRDAEQSRVALLRDRARFAAGVCPCCNRTFDNVRRHMVTQHPDYDVTRVGSRKQPVFKCSCGDTFTTFRGLRTHQGQLRDSVGNWRWDKPDQTRWAAHLTVVTV